ncbi:MAG: hypothetical protein H0W50_05090 [Parachlamydiaceae bacterium]|nr:hypothetical protein [Parachlamydiaceae bacterium]
MITYLLLLVCICLTGCMSSYHPEDGYSKHSTIITDLYLKQISNDGKFFVMGSGRSNSGFNQRVILLLETVGNYDIPRARELFVELEEKFLVLLNNSIEIRPYLDHYPCGTEAFELTLVFKCPKGSFAQPPYLGEVTVSKDKIYYDVDNKEKKIFLPIFSEPYDEAYKIVYGKEKVN